MSLTPGTLATSIHDSISSASTRRSRIGSPHGHPDPEVAGEWNRPGGRAAGDGDRVVDGGEPGSFPAPDASFSEAEPSKERVGVDSSEPGYKGFKDYTPRFLKLYDPWVLGFMAPRVWKMGAEPGLDLYRKHMGRRHLDIGPGTGYFLAKSAPLEGSELTLLDANPHVLDHCAERLAAWEPATV
ncbi:MAG: class I SAM-dependent methyltransferase, partial [Acidimicrobiia bacterium]